MTTRQEVGEIIGKALGNQDLLEPLMTEIDPIISKMIGDDDTEHTEMPRNWNPALKKQYVNFRNHLRRSMRAKW